MLQAQPRAQNKHKTATTIQHYCKIIVANVACTFMARVRAVPHCTVVRGYLI